MSVVSVMPDGDEVPLEVQWAVVRTKPQQERSVKIMAGPLAGAEGVFTGYVNGLERARVLIEILRRPSNVEVPVENLSIRSRISGSDGRSAIRARR